MSRPLPVIALVAALGLVLGACGGEKDTGFNTLPKASPTGGTGGPVTEIQLATGNRFSPVEFKVKAGQPVKWIYSDASSQPHNVQADDGSFNSHPGCAQEQSKCMPGAGKDFTFTFARPGTYAYFCVIHGTAGGVGMSGKVVVE